MPQVYNKHHKKYPANAVYIGRPSKWGNPFSHLETDEAVLVESRQSAIDSHRLYLRKNPQLIVQAREELRGRDLVCWCAPHACHGDLLLQVANAEELRVLVFGGRDYNNKKFIYEALDEIYDPFLPMTVISGAARGADSLALEWAVERMCPFEAYPADWKKHGKAAGPIRNQRMLDEGKPNLGIGFPGDVGTADMAKRLRKAGVAVTELK